MNALRNSVQVFPQAALIVELLHCICKGVREGRGEGFPALAAGPGGWDTVEGLASSDHVTGCLPRFLSVLCGRGGDSPALRERRQGDGPGFQER